MIPLLKTVLSRLISPLTQTIHTPAPSGYRGRIEYDRDKCIGCGLCARACPSTTIKITPDRKIRLDLTECCYCGSCEEVCPVKCIKLTNEYSTGVTDKKDKGLIVK